MIIYYALPIHSEGARPWDFSGRNDAKAEALVLWPPHAKSWFIGEDSDAGRDWGQEKGITEDEIAGWHHWLNGELSEFRELVMDRETWHPEIHGVTKSQTRLSDWTELNWTDSICKGWSFTYIIKHLWKCNLMNYWILVSSINTL